MKKFFFALGLVMIWIIPSLTAKVKVLDCKKNRIKDCTTMRFIVPGGSFSTNVISVMFTSRTDSLIVAVECNGLVSTHLIRPSRKVDITKCYKIQFKCESSAQSDGEDGNSIASVVPVPGLIITGGTGGGTKNRPIDDFRFDSETPIDTKILTAIFEGEKWTFIAPELEQGAFQIWQGDPNRNVKISNYLQLKRASAVQGLNKTQEIRASENLLQDYKVRYHIDTIQGGQIIKNYQEISLPTKNLKKN